MINANQNKIWKQLHKENSSIVEEAITETIKLMAASIKLGAYRFIKYGLETEEGRMSSHKPKKYLGVLNAINSILEENPTLSAKRIWIKLSKYKKDSPYIHKTFEVFFKDQKLYHKDNGKRGIESQLAFDSFRRYVTDAKKNIQLLKKSSSKNKSTQ
jgi:hypothetical protein